METKISNPGFKINNFTHVDQFIDTHPSSDTLKKEPHVNYARFVLNNLRLPAHMAIDFDPYTKQNKLFCNIPSNGTGTKFLNTTDGKAVDVNLFRKVQVVFASTMGWVGIRELNSNHHSYENSIPINQCFGWSPE